MFLKWPISQDPIIGKFRNWAEMKVNYPTNKKNTLKNFSDHFHMTHTENFVQVDHLEKSMKNRLIFSFSRSRKTAGGRKKFQVIHIDGRLSGRNFSKSGPPRASQFELEPNCQSY
jgi:hypothetical protein